MTHVPVDGFSRLLEALDKLEIPYAVGGSTASSVHGIVRFTRDVDIVVKIRKQDVGDLAGLLRGEFYIDPIHAGEAIERNRSFNIIHLASSYKFDLFPLTADRFEQAQFGRRKHETVTIFGGEALEFAVISAEDVILSKLRWYAMGGRVSEQQWNDVLGVIALNRMELDLPYLRHWAQYLGVSQDLETALEERHQPR
ncbi:MAG: hypothetical protein FJW20_11915 [Acidimicrobiia bacterium]|nr:hypothetical protein [Acidimicrobiia bacterium]